MATGQPERSSSRPPRAIGAETQAPAVPARGVVIGLALVAPFWGFVSLIGWNFLP